MFQRQNYSNLNGVTKPVATNGSSLGRRAFGRVRFDFICILLLRLVDSVINYPVMFASTSFN